MTRSSDAPAWRRILPSDPNFENVETYQALLCFLVNEHMHTFGPRPLDPFQANQPRLPEPDRELAIRNLGEDIDHALLHAFLARENAEEQ